MAAIEQAIQVSSASGDDQDEFGIEGAEDLPDFGDGHPAQTTTLEQGDGALAHAGPRGEFLLRKIRAMAERSTYPPDLDVVHE